MKEKLHAYYYMEICVAFHEVSEKFCKELIIKATAYTLNNCFFL